MKRSNWIFIFVGMQGVLYSAFLALDITGTGISLSNRIKFGVVILCLCYTLLRRSEDAGKELFLLRSALFFTVISDFIILFMEDSLYFYGVLTFILVQQLYGMRLILKDQPSDSTAGRNKLIILTLFKIGIQVAVSALVYLVLNYLGISLDRLIVVTVFYFVSLVTNTIYSIRIAILLRGVRSNLLFALGMIMFLLCDINVGLFNLSDFVSLPEHISGVIYTISSILMWTFYAPSQVLIALSADNFRQYRQK